jgi:hypothetical protein
MQNMMRQVVGAIVAVTVCGGVASAQRPANRGGGAGGGGELPFTQTFRRPALSPYMQLQQQSFNPLQNQNAYQMQVLPQLEQQRQQITQLQQSRQLGKLQNQVQQIQRDTSARQVDESIRPTGHRATYMNYSHFYPSAR